MAQASGGGRPRGCSGPSIGYERVCTCTAGFSDTSIGKESACNAGNPRNPGSIPGSGRSPGERIGYPLQYSWASLVAQLVKNPPAMRETWFDLWVGKIPWRRERPLLQYSGLEKSMDCIVNGVTKNWTALSDFHFHLFR